MYVSLSGIWTDCKWASQLLTLDIQREGLSF